MGRMKRGSRKRGNYLVVDFNRAFTVDDRPIWMRIVLGLN
jgi:hypothetical protein